MNLSAILDDARSGLIDLSFRNPLLNYRPLKNRGLEFLANDAISKAESLLDLKSDMQTSISFTADSFSHFYSPAQVESRAKKTQSDAKLHIQEKGVNVLFLACCFINWKEDARAETFNKSPLILIPVSLSIDQDRQIQVTRIEEDVQENFALKEKLKKTGVTFPDLAIDTNSLNNYIAAVEEFCNRTEDWHIERSRISIDIFKTQKYLIYEDLNPNNWDSTQENELPSLISKIVNNEIYPTERSDTSANEIDELDSDEEPLLIRDADLTQLQAILYAQGENTFVIQGPPGTGKSQTITNLIANTASKGKFILFVSEKSTALEVVKANLEKAGLGSLVLDLHSSESKKTGVLKDINSTLELSKNFRSKNTFSKEEYNTKKRDLRDYRAALNSTIADTDFRPEYVLTELSSCYSLIKSIELAHSEIDKKIDEISYLPNNLRVNEYKENIRFLNDFETSLSNFNDEESLYLSDTNFIKNHIVDTISIKKAATNLLAELPKNVEPSRIDFKEKEIYRWYASLKKSIDPNTLNLIKNYKLWDKKWIGIESKLSSILRQLTFLVESKKDYSNNIKNHTWTTSVETLTEELKKAQPNFLQSFVPGTSKKYIDVCLGYFNSPLNEVKIQSYLKIHKSYRDKLEEILKNIEHNNIEIIQEILDTNVDIAPHVINEIQKTIKLINSDNELKKLLTFEPSDIEKLFSKIDQADELNESSDYKKYSDSLAELTGNSNLTNYTKSELRSFCEVILQSINKIDIWRNLADMRVQLIQKNLNWVVEKKIHSISFIYRYVTMKKIEAMMYIELPILSKYSGSDIEGIRNKFSELDKARKNYSRDRILQIQSNSIAEMSSNPSEGFKILLREINKTRNVLTIRNILSKCFEEVRAIKPVIMMSPITVSSFIPRKTQCFDYVIFDEASQVKPSDAIGAILRGGNTIIVGDKMQLPPTSMFDVDSTDDIDYQDILDVDTFESKDTSNTMKNHQSILDLANGLNIPEKRLNWHYRSKFKSLITVSNKEFYDSKLITFPDSMPPGVEEGLQFEYIENGNYDRSGTRRNENEADIVIKQIVDHLKNRKARSLGVATFSMAQKNAIEDKLYQNQETRELISEFNKHHQNEEFFVKNLETIQGDERDSIFISVGYGKSNNSASKAISFGPLTRQNGDRRLNVLISRAKYQCKVFSSIHYHDIETDGIQNQGTKKLKTFLKFAETGDIDIPEVTGEDYDSEFERSVADELRKIGYDVVSQVGSVGFKIDLAIKSTDSPGSYLCGIECDGAAYHSSLSARERDRIRQEILESKGWTILRIWSTDWFRNKNLEISKIDNKIREIPRRK